MMKKRIALLLVLMMAGGMVAGCAGTSDDNVAEGESVQVESGVQEGEEDAEEDAIQENDEDEEEEVVSEAEEFNFAELTVIDTEEIVIKITSVGMDTDSFGDEIFTLTVNIENKSEDMAYSVSKTDLAVNGLVLSSATARFSPDDIPPQKKLNEKIEINIEDLEGYGVTDVTDVDVSFSVKDAESYSGEPMIWQNVHVYPYGEENAVAYDREVQDSDAIFANNEYMTGIVTGYELLSYDYDTGGAAYTVELFVQNPSDLDILYQFSGTSVNDYMINPTENEVALSLFLPAGTCGYFSMTFGKQDLDDNGIETIESLGFTCSVVSYNRQFRSLSLDWEDLTEETVTVALK